MPSDDNPLLFRRAPRELDRRSLRRFASTLVENVTGGRPFLALVTDDRELRRLNRQFLGKDLPTDVLSFPAEPGGESLGEIAISADRAREQAAEFGHTVEDEIRILLLHGALHLIGLDHERDRGRMARAETGWRKKLGLPTALTERTGA